MTETILTTAFLSLCSYTDIRKRVVYLKLLIPFFIAGVLLCALSGKNAVISGAAGACAGFFILILSMATKGAVGEGDGLVLMITGFYLGFFMNLKLIFTALFLSAMCSVAAVIIKGWKKDMELPFMPFLLAAFIVIKAGELQ